jgi:seryl-tRNA synthetase
MSRQRIDPSSLTAATEDEIPDLVDRLKEINGQIEDLTREKKEIEIRLSKAAQAMPHEPLKDTKREGRRVSLSGRKWRIPVVFTSDSLIKSFQDKSAKHRELEAIAGEHLGHFFKSPAKWETRFEDGQRFRKEASEMLGEKAAAFIVACRALDKDGIAKSSTVVGIDEAEEVTP